MEIINNVKDYKMISWEAIKTYEFNNLKEIDNKDLIKLKNSIVNNGFSFPFYVWAGHRYVIDGNGRQQALNELEQEGYSIPELPIVEIIADNKNHAKKLVLHASSSYGKATHDSWENFSSDMEIDDDFFDSFNIDIPDWNINSGDDNDSDSEKEIKENNSDTGIPLSSLQAPAVPNNASLTFKYDLDTMELIKSKLYDIDNDHNLALLKLLKIN